MRPVLPPVVHLSPSTVTGSTADLRRPLSQEETSFRESMLHPDSLAVCVVKIQGQSAEYVTGWGAAGVSDDSDVPDIPCVMKLTANLLSTLNFVFMFFVSQRTMNKCFTTPCSQWRYSCVRRRCRQYHVKYEYLLANSVEERVGIEEVAEVDGAV